MTDRLELPDLASLSDAEKDQLIKYLWSEVRVKVKDGRVTAAVPPATPGAASTARSASLSATLRDAGSARRGFVGAVPVKPKGLRRGFGWLGSTPVAVVVGLVSLALLADAGVGMWQRQALAEDASATEALEMAAFNRLYVELLRAVPMPDGRTYRLVLAMTSNAEPPLYVMLQPVRVFVQQDLAWREVPSRDPLGRGARVVATTGEATEYEVDITVDFTDWTELVPGYMHLRVDSDMLVSQRREPADDIVERRNRFNIYLKPHGADDDSIQRRSNMPGPPPDYIPMPPH